MSVSHDNGTEIENLGTYEYDGTFRRITVDAGSSAPELRHVHYNEQWKAVEERDTDDATITVQQIWGIRSRSDLIARDRDATGNGTLDERLYVATDAMFSGTSIMDTSGDVEERYGYSAFGKRRVMKADFDVKLDSEFDWRYGFHGEFLDPETQLVNYGYRYYIPAIGGWASKDPIREVEGKEPELLIEGPGLYKFVGNNSINSFDDRGLAAGGVVLAFPAALQMAAAAAGVTLCICLMNENCRDEAARLVCISACDAAHHLQSIACRLKRGPKAQQRCLEIAFDDYADCIQHCNRQF